MTGRSGLFRAPDGIAGADAAVALVLDDLDARVADRSCALHCRVARAVVDDVYAIDERGDAAQRRRDQLLLVGGTGGGVAYDEAAGDEVRVTVIAAGFDHAPQPKILRPTQLRTAIGGGRAYDPTNFDIPAFLRYNPDEN